MIFRVYTAPPQTLDVKQKYHDARINSYPFSFTYESAHAIAVHQLACCPILLLPGYTNVQYVRTCGITIQDRFAWT